MSETIVAAPFDCAKHHFKPQTATHPLIVALNTTTTIRSLNISITPAIQTATSIPSTSTAYNINTIIDNDDQLSLQPSFG
eukprot:jgi/Psemu1/301963/fgenesh1_kg.53_\